MARTNPICSVYQCGKTSRVKGLCDKHYKRFWKYGDPLASRCAANGAILEWLKRNASHAGEECLTWPFPLGPSGRGQAEVNGQRMNAARAMCIIAYGEPSAEKMDAAHRCHNGHLGCVNPRHLFWATRQENNEHRPRMRRGAAHGNAKVSPVDVIAARLMAESMTQRAVARELGLHPTHVGKIVRKEIWAHL